jgi:hypothetical protein
MSKKLFRVILPLVILCSLMGLSVSCTYFSPLIGTWQNSVGSDTVEFTRDGNIIIEQDNYVITGTWSTVSSDVINVTLEGDAGDLMGMTGGSSWQYTISGNALTIVEGGSTFVYDKIMKTTNSETVQVITTNTTPSITVTYPKGGETFRVGQVITITWKTTNLSQDAQVVINYELPTGSGFGITNIKGVPNAGNYKWTVSSNVIINGGKAQITITNNSGQYLVAKGSSGFFTVTN